MAKVNTLFKKGFLLAGVIMAANMFIGNEMMAMDKEKKDEILLGKVNNNMAVPPTNTNPDINIQNNKILQEKDKTTEQKIRIKDFFYIGPCKYIGFLLQWENTINLVGGALFTFANGLYNFYENKPGFYFDHYSAGWNSNPFFAKGYLQFCPNINLGRGIFWLIMHYAMNSFIGAYSLTIKEKLKEKNIMDEEETNIFMCKYVLYLFNEYTPFVIGNKLAGKANKKNLVFICFSLRLLQNFVSVPLIIHLTSEFTISIAFDAIMWMVVTHFVVGKTYDAEVEGMKDTLTNLFFPKKTNSIEN